MPDSSRRVVLCITGMKDNTCRERIMEVLVPMRGVKDVNVSLIRAQAFVVCTADCACPELMRAISRAGYSASITRDDPGATRTPGQEISG